MYWIIKCIVQGKQARVINADLRHPSWHSCNVKTQICVTRPQCVNYSNSFIDKRIFWYPVERIPIEFTQQKPCWTANATLHLLSF